MAVVPGLLALQELSPECSRLARPGPAVPRLSKGNGHTVATHHF